MIKSLNTIEWARLREWAKQHTVEEWRILSRSSLYCVAKKREMGSRKTISEAIARECEKWCKDARA